MKFYYLSPHRRDNGGICIVQRGIYFDDFEAAERYGNKTGFCMVYAPNSDMIFTSYDEIFSIGEMHDVTFYGPNEINSVYQLPLKDFVEVIVDWSRYR